MVAGESAAAVPRAPEVADAAVAKGAYPLARHQCLDGTRAGAAVRPAGAGRGPLGEQMARVHHGAVGDGGAGDCCTVPGHLCHHVADETPLCDISHTQSCPCYVPLVF